MSEREEWPAAVGTNTRHVVPPAAKGGGELGRLALALLGGLVLAVLLIIFLGLDGRKDTAGVRGAASGAVAAAEKPAQAAGDDKPSGLPVTRDDWIITKDYSATGGTKPQPQNNQGALVIGFFNNKNAFGADIVATHSGKVKLLLDDSNYGNLVYVFGTNYTTTYGHLQDITVKEGDQVKRGQVIGHMGATGQTSGPAVDYQVWQKSVNLNPMDFCACNGTQGPGAGK